jgi:hypothetical protein
MTPVTTGAEKLVVSFSDKWTERRGLSKPECLTGNPQAGAEILNRLAKIIIDTGSVQLRFTLAREGNFHSRDRRIIVWRRIVWAAEERPDLRRP